MGMDWFFKARFRWIVTRVSIRVAEARGITAAATKLEVENTGQ
jgi:hypothetical protein